MIVGITGTIGAGKGTVVEYLKSKGFKYYSASGILKEILLSHGETPDRNHFSPLARELRQKDSAGLARLAYERMMEDKVENAVIEALHTVGEATFIREKGGLLIGVDADVKKRYERTHKRGEEKDHVSYEEFLEHAEREDEGTEESGHNIRGVIQVADVIVTNNGSLEELRERLEKVLAEVL